MAYIYKPTDTLKKDALKLESDLRLVAESLKRVQNKILEEYSFDKKDPSKLNFNDLKTEFKITEAALHLVIIKQKLIHEYLHIKGTKIPCRPKELFKILNDPLILGSLEESDFR